MNRPLPRMTRSDEDFVPPVDRLISSLDGTWYKLSEVVILVGKSESTLRRLIGKGVTKAPSAVITQGKNTYYLYSPDDVRELQEHFENESRPIMRKATQ